MLKFEPTSVLDVIGASAPPDGPNEIVDHKRVKKKRGFLSQMVVLTTLSVVIVPQLYLRLTRGV